MIVHNYVPIFSDVLRYTVNIVKVKKMASFGGLTTLNPVPHQDGLEIAGRLIDKFQQEDRNSLDVSELLRIPKHSKCGEKIP